MDGVLIDTEKWLNLYWRQAAKEAGYTITKEEALSIRSLAAKFAEPYLKNLYGEEFDYKSIRNRRKELMREHIKACGIERKEGVLEVLDDLRERGVKTAVATATDEQRTTEYLTQIGILDKFDQIICADMVKNGKPEPDIYVYACEKIGISPKEALAVEDSPNGITAAYRAGLSVVMVPDLTGPDEKTEAMTVAAADGLLGLKDLCNQGLLERF